MVVCTPQEVTFTLAATLWVHPVSGHWAYFWVWGTGVSHLGTLMTFWGEVPYALHHLSLPLLPYPYFHKRETQAGGNFTSHEPFVHKYHCEECCVSKAPRQWAA